jgi:hypothetical protein
MRCGISTLSLRDRSPDVRNILSLPSLPQPAGEAADEDSDSDSDDDDDDVRVTIGDIKTGAPQYTWV